MQFPKLDQTQIDVLVAYAVQVTEQSFPQILKSIEPERSEKAKQAEKLILSKTFGCNTQAVAELVSILLDEKIIVEKKRPSVLTESLLPGAMVVGENLKCYQIAVVNSDWSVRLLSVEGIPHSAGSINWLSYSKASLHAIQAFFKQRHGTETVEGA